MVINKFPNREVYEKIKEKGNLGADDVNVLEDYPGLEWKGEYSSTTTYVKGDIVYYENMLYVMISASVIGAIPGIDNDWIDFAKRSVTSSDVTNALGFTPADSTKVLPLSGGTLTGNLTGKYIIGTWLQATDTGHLATTPTKIPVFDDKGWIYYRTPAEILKDIGASSGYTLTEADKTEIAGKVVADGTEFTLSDFPTALKNPKALTFTGAATGTYDGSAALTVNIPAGGASGSGGALKAMSAVSGYIGIPAADLPENGVVWMCFGSGDSTELYTGTVTIQDAWIAVNDMLVITNGTVNPLNQVSWVSDGLAVYGLSTSDYRGVYQVVGRGPSGSLTFTRAVEATYDGTEDVVVNIPSGGASSGETLELIGTITLSEAVVDQLDFDYLKKIKIQMVASDSAATERFSAKTDVVYRKIDVNIGNSGTDRWVSLNNMKFGTVNHPNGAGTTIIIDCNTAMTCTIGPRVALVTGSPEVGVGNAAPSTVYREGQIKGIRITTVVADGVENTATGTIMIWGVKV